MKKIILTLIFTLMSSISFADGHLTEDQKKKIAQFCNVKEQAVIEASHDDSKSKIRRQFKKYMKTKMMNKIILSKFVEQIA